MNEEIKALLGRAVFLDEADAHRAAQLVGRVERRGDKVFTDVSIVKVGGKDMVYGAEASTERILGRMNTRRRGWC